MGVVGNLQYTPSKVVIHALKDIKRPKGVSFEEILGYAVGKYQVNQNTFKTALKHALKRGLKYKILEVHNSRYKLSNHQQKPSTQNNQKSDKHSKKTTNRRAKKHPGKRRKKISVRRRVFRGNAKNGKPISDRRSLRLQKKTLDLTTGRRAKSELLRSKSRDATSLAKD